jgi:AcrR family transcriptional regulator
MAKDEARGRREQILELAARRFARFGFAGTSMRALGQDAGISAAAIYRHYPSKLELFEQVIEAGANGRDTRDHLESLRAHESIEAVLRALSLHLLSTARNRPELLRLLLLTSVCDDEAAARLLQEFRAPYVDFLQSELHRRIEANELEAVDPKITARCYVGMVIACAINTNLWDANEDGARPNDRSLVENNAPIFARGLRRSDAKGDATK